jgi:hypothetical protein
MNLQLFYMAFFIFVISLSKMLAQEDINFPFITSHCINNHSYLCFNGNQYIHDPDCKCTQKFEGVLEIKKNKYPIILYSSFLLKDKD